MSPRCLAPTRFCAVSQSIPSFRLIMTEFPSELVRASLLSFLRASGEECFFCTSGLVLGHDPCPLGAWHQRSSVLYLRAFRSFRLIMTEFHSELVRASLLSFLWASGERCPFCTPELVLGHDPCPLRAWHQHGFVLYLRAFRGFRLIMTEFPSELVRASLLSFLRASGEGCPFCTSELVLGHDPGPLRAWHQHSFELYLRALSFRSFPIELSTRLRGGSTPRFLHSFAFRASSCRCLLLQTQSG